MDAGLVGEGGGVKASARSRKLLGPLRESSKGLFLLVSVEDDLKNGREVVSK